MSARLRDVLLILLVTVMMVTVHCRLGHSQRLKKKLFLERRTKLYQYKQCNAKYKKQGGVGKMCQPPPFPGVAKRKFSVHGSLRIRPNKRYSPRFPCPDRAQFRSRYPPSSVHRIKPGDIGIIGSIGDSLTAGTGAEAGNIFEVLNENRGLSFGTGGDGTWYQQSTLANIIKQYNPYLKGTSHGNTKVLDLKPPKGDRGLNLSKSGAVAREIPAMARELVKKIKRMKGWRREWKLVTLLIGHNDLCSYSCTSTIDRLGLGRRSTSLPDTSARAYGRNVAKGVEILHRNLPRTLVLLLPMADVTNALKLVNKPFVCTLSHWYECPCLFEKGLMGNEAKTKKLLLQYKYELEKIAASPRYSDREDFSVELEPTLVTPMVEQFNPKAGRDEPDLSLLAPDCFHFSTKLHGLMGRNLWNNLLQPVGRKSLDYTSGGRIQCPRRDMPYLATKRNSRP